LIGIDLLTSRVLAYLPMLRSPQQGSSQLTSPWNASGGGLLTPPVSP